MPVAPFAARPAGTRPQSERVDDTSDMFLFQAPRPRARRPWPRSGARSGSLVLPNKLKNKTADGAEEEEGKVVRESSKTTEGGVREGSGTTSQ